VTPACASCAAELAADARFCSVCGAPVAEAAPPREARKVVSALFADVVGSTALGERMDPEDFKGVIGGAVARMASAVERFGGEVFEYAGDGLLALFGAPVAHEDDPERAILAGLEIVDSIAAESDGIAREWEIEGFAVRVGIETGLAILGPVGSGSKLEYGAVGDALNTAARLQAAARPGAVLVGSRTQRLVAERFEFDAPVELELKGKTQPVTAYRARRARPRSAAGRRPVEAELVGRDEELRRGLELVSDVLAGSGRILFITGEAGVGKSRLLGEIRKRFIGGESPGGVPRWLEGRCVSYGEALPYWPFRALLREWLGELAGERGPEGIGESLSDELERLAGERAGELIEPLRLVLGAAAAAHADSPDPPPQVIQERIRAAVAELFERLAGEGPVALALDDLHWADASSLSLVERLLESTERAPILLVAVARSERDHPAWALREETLRRLAHRAREAALERLSGDRDRELLETLIGSETLPSELERRLLARAEGNPFYLEELVRSMIEAGALRRAGEGWTFDREVPVEIPETIEKLIGARIDRLSGPAQRLLEVAAVLGRQFPVALLEAMAQGAGADESFRELHAAEVLRDAARWPVPFCAFRHTLIQETAYRGLLRRRRSELHAEAIVAIESLYADRIDEFAGMVAHHADDAGDDQRSLEYHRRAADAAARVYSAPEAIEHYAGALAAARRLGLHDADPGVRTAIFARGDLRFSIGDLEGSRGDYEAAIAAARESGDAELQVEASLGLVSYWRSRDFARATELLEETVRASDQVPPPARVNALARLSIQYAQHLRLDSATEIGERALALANAERDRRSLDRAKDALKLVAQQVGDVERLEALTDDLLRSLRERPEDAFYIPWVLLESAFVPLARGRWDQAQGRLDEALELTRTQGYRYQEPLFLDALCWLHRAKGDYGEAIQQGRSAARLAHAHGGDEWASWTDATLGWALLEAGEPGQAADCLERGLRTAEGANPPAQLTRCVCLLACARSMLGDRAAAEALAARGEELLARISTPPGHAWLFGAHAYLGIARVRRDAGEDERAEAIAAPILSAAERSGWSGSLAGAALLDGLE
jgi:class 3 adenylate cyclase/tetratricopeptide (TPR) repeat protein